MLRYLLSRKQVLPDQVRGEFNECVLIDPFQQSLYFNCSYSG